MSTLVSVHTPKAGGSSVRVTLARHFGAGLFADYSENPAHPLSPRVLDPLGYMSRHQPLPPGARCIHGHFHPGKYDLGDAFLFTLLREPVDNMISIYFFWRQMVRQNDPLHDYFLDNNLGLVDAARLPLLQRLLSWTYFGEFDMGRFDLIGRYDDRETALARLAHQYGADFDFSARENVTPLSEERHAARTDPKLRRQLEDILADDIRFFERYAR
jgi:hypothetical protein